MAKIFEEVKIMFADLPSKIESRVDPEYRRSRRFHPMMMEEMFHMSKGAHPHIPMLMVLSTYKNEFPWIYEIGSETIKLLQAKKSREEKESAARQFLEILEFTFRHPMMREMTMHSKDFHMMFRETQHLFERYFHQYLKRSKKEEGDNLL